MAIQEILNLQAARSIDDVERAKRGAFSAIHSLAEKKLFELREEIDRAIPEQRGARPMVLDGQSDREPSDPEFVGFRPM